jgi:hypothetical protein
LTIGLTLLACAGLAVSGLAAPPPALARGELVADYELRGTRASSRPAPPVTDLGPGPNKFRRATVDGRRRSVLAFPRGNGLSVDVRGLVPPDNYSISVLFKFETLTGYRRVLDYSGGVRDRGLYTFDGVLVLFPRIGPVGSAIGSRRYSHVVMTRTRRGIVKVYLDGRFQFGFYDARRLGVLSQHRVLRFFQDNFVGEGTGEHSAGTVARISLYAGSLSEAQVRRLETARDR